MKRFRIALAGCGNMARSWVTYALGRADCEIVALADVVPENATRIAAAYGFSAPVHSSITTAIAEQKPNVVFDVTVPQSHASVVIPSLEAGCDVFGEKPMSVSLEESRSMVDVASRTGRTYAVMQNRRYNRNIRNLRHIVTEGSIGDVGGIHADFFLGPHFGGFRDLMDNPLILDMAIHTFDQARFITGADAVSVYCHEWNPKVSWYKGNASAVCIFEMSNGAVFVYQGSWCAEGAPTSWESAWRVVGSGGTAVWDGISAPYREVVRDSGTPDFFRTVERQVPSYEWSNRDGHWGCLDEMFASLVEARRPETDCRDNIRTMEMVFGAIESAKTARKIFLS